MARHAAEWLTLNKKSDFAATAAASPHEHLRAQNYLIFNRNDFGWTQSRVVAGGNLQPATPERRFNLQSYLRKVAILKSTQMRS